MRAHDVHRRMMALGTWVDWGDTTDGFHFGDPGTEVRGIAVGWKPYFRDLKEALSMGCNFFLAHESVFRQGTNGDETAAASGLERSKLTWLKESGMVVYRCHDVWDVVPEVGVKDSWARGLGFADQPVAADHYHRVQDVAGRTFGSLCEQIASRVSSIGQEGILTVGDADARVNRLGLGTGAASEYERMIELGADACVICDDYFRFVRDGALLRDLGIPFVVVNHATAEEWGIRNLHEFAKREFPSVPAHFMEQGCSYRLFPVRSAP